MLPLSTREQLRDALSRGLGPEYADPVVWVPVEHPDYSERGLQPSLWWSYEDYETPDPPYVEVAMSLTPSGVIEEDNQSVDRQLAVEDISDGSQDAHVVTTRGRRVYDVLNLRVTAEGGMSITADVDGDGVDEQVDYLSASERAEAACRRSMAFFLELFDRTGGPAVDEFDADGNLLPQTAAENRLHADELSPPLLVRPEPGRGPADVTDQVDADGQQWDGACRLHYFDTWRQYSLSATDAEVNTTIDVS